MEPLILALILLGALAWWLNRRRSRRPRVLARTRSRTMGSLDSVPPRLMNKLDSLTRDRRVSERLIERIAFNHPRRSKRWCVEKAIYDIQRDRRS